MLGKIRLYIHFFCEETKLPLCSFWTAWRPKLLEPKHFNNPQLALVRHEKILGFDTSDTFQCQATYFSVNKHMYKRKTFIFPGNLRDKPNELYWLKRIFWKELVRVQCRMSFSRRRQLNSTSTCFKRKS